MIGKVLSKLVYNLDRIELLIVVNEQVREGRTDLRL